MTARTFLLTFVASVFVLCVSSTVLAQVDPHLIFENIDPIAGETSKSYVDPVTGVSTSKAAIKLANDFKPELLGNGDVVVRCEKMNGRCSNIGSGSGGGTAPPPPSITFTAPEQVVPGAESNPMLVWSATAGSFCRGVSVTGGVVPGWTGSWQSGNQFPLGSLRDATAQKTYNFTLGCYSPGNASSGAAGYSQAQHEVVLEPSSTVVTPGEGYCSTAYPQTQPQPPSGWTGVTRNFADIFEGVMFSDIISSGRTATGHGAGPVAMNEASQYLVVAFDVPSDAVNGRSFKINFVEPQAGPTTNGNILVSISPCAGDFRKTSQSIGSNDPWAAGVCRREVGSSNGSLRAQVGDGSYCKLVKGARMYLNISSTSFWQAPATSGCVPGQSHCGKKMTAQ